MAFWQRFVYRIKRSEHPCFKGLKKLIQALLSPPLLAWPRLLQPLLRVLFELHWGLRIAFRSLMSIVYWGPLFWARCEKVGRDVKVIELPYVMGPVAIELEDGVSLGGNISILSGSVYDKPLLRMEKNSSVGWNCKITVNREVTIGENAMVSFDCRISDSDGHRREADLRAAGMPPLPEECLPVRIEKDAWIGNGSHIMKGVTIGQGAIVAANSLVISDIPAYSLAIGNPAEVFFRNVGLPSTARKKKKGELKVTETKEPQ